MPARITLVLGGASSGKSEFAESLFILDRRAVYIATAEAGDDEMRERIAAHQGRRDGRWTTVEAPLDLVSAIREADTPDGAILVDCLTLWLGNLMGAHREVAGEVQGLIDALDVLQGRIVLVSNELGLGVVPENALARAFRDIHGTMNQCVAAAAGRVEFVAAGLPLTLKDDGR